MGTSLLTLGLAVGASPSYLGVHYPGDVVVGWILAAGCAVAAHTLLPLAL